MIVILAPYNSKSLGTIEKIHLAIEALYKIDKDILFIDTEFSKKSKKVCFSKITINNFNLNLLNLPFIYNKKLSTLNSFFRISEIVNFIKHKGSPKLVWTYNLYALNVLLTKKIYKIFKCPCYLDFVDGIFARPRLSNFVDYFMYLRTKKIFNLSFNANFKLKNDSDKISHKSIVFPSIIKKANFDFFKKKKIFNNKNKITIGYFGSLVEEKGIDTIYNLIKVLPKKFNFIICGKGKYKSKIINLKKKNNNVQYYYFKNIKNVNLKMSECDILLNPHRVKIIDEIFPFKLVQYIVSRRLVISTKVNNSNLINFTNGVHFVDDNFDSFYKAILNHQKIYLLKKKNIFKNYLNWKKNYTLEDYSNLIAYNMNI